MTREAIGEIVGVTRERVLQVEREYRAYLLKKDKNMDSESLNSIKHPRTWGCHITGVERIDAFLDYLLLWFSPRPKMAESNFDKVNLCDFKIGKLEE